MSELVEDNIHELTRLLGSGQINLRDYHNRVGVYLEKNPHIKFTKFDINDELKKYYHLVRDEGDKTRYDCPKNPMTLDGMGGNSSAMISGAILSDAAEKRMMERKAW